jgi:hypothetical protein
MDEPLVRGGRPGCWRGLLPADALRRKHPEFFNQWSITVIFRALAYILERLFDLTIGDNSEPFDETRRDFFDGNTAADLRAAAEYKAQWERDAAWWHY